MIRTILWFICVALILIPAFLAALISKLFRIEGCKAVQFLARVFVPIVYAVAGYKIEKHGFENIPDGPALFVGNHQGLFDTIMAFSDIGETKPIVAKIEASRIPVVSMWMRMMGCIFLDRGNLRQSLEAMKKVEETLESGKSVLIFPEGTRSKGGPMKEFKSGSFRPAVRAGVPVVPFVIDGSYNAWDLKKRIKPCTCRLTILPPIETADLDRTKTQELAAKVQAAIKAELDKNNAE